MVYFFKSTGTSSRSHDACIVVSPPASIYMGHDKEENEQMIQHGRPQDIWFHVEDLSSAHVYLEDDPRDRRWPMLDAIPEELLADCCQLVKQNSIEGCKRPSVRVVYCRHSNLRKLPGHAPGQVTFHSEKECRHATAGAKQSDRLKRLEKTKVEDAEYSWLDDRKRHLDQEAAVRKAEMQRERERKAEEARREQERRDAESYKSVMRPEKMSSNRYDGPVDVRKFEEDFM